MGVVGAMFEHGSSGGRGACLSVGAVWDGLGCIQAQEQLWGGVGVVVGARLSVGGR